ncbi:MAG: LacI family DNA-binding transcriptional regulator [Candidatus Methylacidiphilales bacterium]|nr:LacI family DNA-binding transcriptional regulator [Candidatus Methylacidiphilales bacterium]
MNGDTTPARPLTTRDIARHAGVAQSTVSRALNNSPLISVAERTRILGIAEKLGYQLNPFVSAFTAQVRSYRRSPKGATLAFLDCTAEGNTSFGKDYSDGAAARAQSLGYRVELFQLKEIDGSIERFNKILHARNTYGLLVLPVARSPELRGLRLDNLAAATVDYTLRSPDLSRACTNYFEGMQMALRKLQAMGYKRICFCARGEDVTTISPHWLGAYTGWREQIPPAERMECYIAAEYNRTHFQKWLKHAKPDAIITNSEHFFPWAEEIGFGRSKVAHTALSTKKHPPTFEIDQNPHQVGSAAIDLIIGQIHRNERGIPAIPKTVLVNCSWIDHRDAR